MKRILRMEFDIFRGHSSEVEKINSIIFKLNDKKILKA